MHKKRLALGSKIVTKFTFKYPQLIVTPVVTEDSHYLFHRCLHC